MRRPRLVTHPIHVKRGVAAAARASCQELTSTRARVLPHDITPATRRASRLTICRVAAKGSSCGGRNKLQYVAGEGKPANDLIGLPDAPPLNAVMAMANWCGRMEACVLVLPTRVMHRPGRPARLRGSF